MNINHQTTMGMVPVVVEQSSSGERSFDLFSRLMRDRIVFLTGTVEDSMASILCAQLLFLESESPKQPISMFINSGGGVVTSGLSIYDTMQFIKCPVDTYCLGQACSMGSFLLAGGTGVRRSLPNSRVMIHQPSGGSSGQVTEILIQAAEILKLKEMLTREYAKNSKGKTTYEQFLEMMERDKFLNPQEALDLGLIDEIVTKRPE